MDEPVALLDERIKCVHKVLRCSSAGLYRAKELSQRALAGLSKHGLHFGASFGRCRLMNEYEIGSDGVFGDLHLPEREAHLCGDFMQFVLGQWHHVSDDLTRLKVSDRASKKRRSRALKSRHKDGPRFAASLG